MPKILLLSGRISSGKTTLSKRLNSRFAAEVIRTKELIDGRNSEKTREARIEAGRALDDQTNYTWIADFLRKNANWRELVIVDSIRFAEQALAIRQDFGSAVVHVHLTAPAKILEERYAHKIKDPRFLNPQPYEELEKDRSDDQLRRLEQEADVVIDTTLCDVEDVYTRVAAHLNLFGRNTERLVDVLVGAQYGSEGKGHIAAYLAGEYDVLVRVGGPNAGHTVFERAGSYVHHQLPSGTRRSNAELLIGAGAVIDPAKLLKEIGECGVDGKRLSIDPNAMIIEEFDKDKEAELEKEIGSTKQGVGQATIRRISRLSENNVRLASDVDDLKPFVRPVLEKLEDAYRKHKRIMLEGTQGTGLSLFHGDYPYVTSRDTCVSGALAEAGIAPSRVRKIVMVCRPYPIRVTNPSGTSGPMGRPGREINWDIVSQRSGVPVEQLKKTEKTSTTKRDRRVAEFDWAAIQKAATLNGPTDLALTFCDYISRYNENAHRFEQLTQETIRYIEELEKVAGAPVSLISTRFEERSIIDRRTW